MIFPPIIIDSSILQLYRGVVLFAAGSFREEASRLASKSDEMISPREKGSIISVDSTKVLA